jgi:5'-deoxynucleotidase YfbR-like HD superfamily hydrolase
VYQYNIEEIAHALSHICRYSGHSRVFYSVAQHSVMVAELVEKARPKWPRGLYRAALLHDAAEAFCLDVPSPIKAMPMMEGYRKWLHVVEEAIEDHFFLGKWPMDPLIKWADLTALATEKRDVLGPSPHDAMWIETVRGTLPPPRVKAIKPLSPKLAKAAFLKHWELIR